MKKILAAVDGSEASLHALHDAEELARELNAELTVVYVSPPYSVPMEFSTVSTIDLNESEHRRGETILKDAVRELHGLEVKTANLHGPPAETISDLALAENFDLVVVGNEHKSPLARMFLGSVADKLVHTCPRPVLVVR